MKCYRRHGDCPMYIFLSFPDDDNVYEDMESINIFDDEQCDQSLFDQSDSEILTSHISYNNVTFLQISYFFIYTPQQLLSLLASTSLTVIKYHNIY